MKKRKDGKLPAGDFTSWLQLTRNAWKTDTGAIVPCGECTACCRSSYFIHIGPDETKTLSVIPDALKFPAPGLPKGNVVLGYNQEGQCPMLVDQKCSIYENRPKTCRNYDCRIFPATGLSVGDADKELISRQAHRWIFNFPDQNARKHFSALKAAARFLNKFSKLFPDGFVPGNTTQQAVLAIKIYEVFLSVPNDFDFDAHTDETQKIADAIMISYERISGEAGRVTSE